MIVSGSLVLISCFLAGITYRPPSSSMPFDRHVFAPVCVLPHISFFTFSFGFVFLFFVLFLLVLFVFLPLDHQQRFFTRERVACLYGCTTLVFDYLYEFRAIDRWGCRVRTLIVHGWREIRLGRRGLSVLRRMYVGSGWRKGFGSMFTKISICLLCCFLLLYVNFVSQKENDLRCKLWIGLPYLL